MSQENSCFLGLILQLPMKLHYKCTEERIDVINYKDESGILISDINMVSHENLNAALRCGTGNASALRDKITETLRDNSGLKIVKMGASRKRYSTVPSKK
nr:hypothetical protein CFP56_59474 [Quercus suber]